MNRDPHTPVRIVTLANGVRLEVAEKGPSDGVPLVLLHGITDSRHSFDPLWPHLPDHVRAIAVSLRGHGQSDQRPLSYATADFAADIALLAQQLGCAPMVLVGHAMGSSIALQLASERPELVRAVVGIGAFARYGNKADLRAYRMIDLATLRDPVPDEFARAFQTSTLAAPIGDALLDLFVRESCKVPAHIWRAAFDGLLDDRFHSALPKVNAPVLLLWGSADRMATWADQTTLCRSLPRARLMVYERAGHGLHWEQPLRTARDLADFVAALDTADAATLEPVAF